MTTIPRTTRNARARRGRWRSKTRATGCGDGALRVVLTLEEAGRAGLGVVAHLAPDTARRLRAALAAALREIGEPPGP